MNSLETKDIRKGKQRIKKEKQAVEHEGEGKNYFRWNKDMERALADVLREERSLGHKGDGGWKAIAYNTASAILSVQFGLQISADNIRNHVKSWKKFYGIVSDILSQSGFSWDSTKKMINIDEDHVWEAYVKSHEDAKCFRFKVIENWDDIVDLCAKDRATGEGAETCAEATEIMIPPNEVDLDGDTQGLDDIHIIDDISPNSTSCQRKRNHASTTFSDIPLTKKKCAKDVVADSIARMALSFEEFIRADTKSLDPKEVYEEVQAIPDLSEEEHLKACSWLIENDKQFLMLKALPIERKKAMLMMFIARKT